MTQLCSRAKIKAASEKTSPNGPAPVGDDVTATDGETLRKEGEDIDGMENTGAGNTAISVTVDFTTFFLVILHSFDDLFGLAS